MAAIISKGKPLDLPTPFPVELVEAIIDHLHDNIESLQACSLVARQWLPTSRFHLIPTIEINHSNSVQLLELLANPLCRLSPSVRTIKLRNKYKNESRFWVDNIIPVLGDHFPSVTGFSLQDMFIRDLSPDTASILHTTFPNIETFEITSCGFYDCDQYTHLLSSFPNVKTIRSGGCNYTAYQWNEHSPPSHQLPLLVQSMTVEGDDTPFMQWLEVQNFPHLEHLDTGILHMQNVGRTSTIVSRAGSSLRSLWFGFGHDFMPTKKIFRHLDLSRNTSLEELTVALGCTRIMMPPNMGLDTGISSFVLSLFSTISSTKLHTVNLVLYVRSPERLTEMDWNALDNLIQEKAMEINLMIQLIDLSSDIPSERFIKEAVEILSSGLPNLANRESIEIEHHIPEQYQDTYQLAFC